MSFPFLQVNSIPVVVPCVIYLLQTTFLLDKHLVWVLVCLEMSVCSSDEYMI